MAGLGLERGQTGRGHVGVVVGLALKRVVSQAGETKETGKVDEIERSRYTGIMKMIQELLQGSSRAPKSAKEE